MMRQMCFGLVVTIAIAACGGSRVSSDASAKPMVLLLMKSNNAAFWHDLALGVTEAAGDSISVEVRAGRDESDVSSQIRELDGFYNRFVLGRTTPALTAVILTPSASGPEFVDALKRFRDARVPLVLADTRIERDIFEKAGTDYSAFVGSSNSDGGKLAAQTIHKALPRGGEILLLNGVESQESAQQRRRGFLDACDSLVKATGWKIDVIERSANWQRTAAMTFVDGQLRVGRQFAAIFAANDEMALGAVEAFRQHANMARPVAVVGFDATDEARQAVEDGSLTGTVAQNPRLMGGTALRLAIRSGAKELTFVDSVIPVVLVAKRR